MRLTRLYLMVVLYFAATSLCAQYQSANQQGSNLRQKRISTRQSSVVLDSLSIFPHTFYIPEVHPSLYKLDAINSTLYWLSVPPQDSVTVRYRVFASRLNATTQRLNFDSIRNNFLLQKPVNLKFNRNANAGLFDFGNINYNGSFGRGISFGNSQDAVLNSNLNLQLNGYIGDSLELTAAITDNNIPIQPDGNTQDLRDFDRIFLQVRKRTWSLSFGDIDIRQSQNYFLNFYKRLQGAAFSTTNQLAPGITNNLLVSGSVAKGKFNRNILQPIEGNQGPYRLQGANNELFFTILAGTERVFMDGEMLQRGEDQDYVINYNTAELTFTPKRMITKDKRIQVEFEYADRNFLNATLYANNEINFKNKLNLSIGAFSNQDAKNSPIQQTLDNDQKQFLADIGDGIDTAFYSGARRDTFSTGKILYKIQDTVYNGNIRDSIFVYDTTANLVLYDVAFSFLGSGRGDYIQLSTAANGRVYQWVAPVNGIKQGDWEPVILLVTPKKLQMATVAAAYQVSAKTLLKAEVAVSKYDINTYSSKDKDNDNATAIKLQVADTNRTFKLFKRQLGFSATAGYEMVQERFRALERIRNIEFKRDWSLPFDAPAATEHITNASAGIADIKGNRLRYEVTNYRRSDNFNGYRHRMEQEATIKGWRLQTNISLTTIKMTGQSGFYFRPTIDITKQLKRFKYLLVGGNFLGEHNYLTNTQTNQFTPFSFGFNVWQAYIKSPQDKLNKWALTYFTRSDFFPQQNKMIRADRSDNINFLIELLGNDKHQFKLNTTYRKLHIINASLSPQKADESVLGRIEYYVNEWKGLLTGNVLYEAGAGQEQRREFTFIEVPAGQGEYTWIDYNSNGIRELNEFELALFPDQRKFIRVNSPTNQFVKANYLQFNYSAEINPRAVIDIKTAKGFKKILSRTSLASQLQISKKEIAAGKYLFNPFTKDITDSTLLTLNTFLSNTLFFNRLSPVWGIDITQVTSNIKSLISFGVESRSNRTLTLRMRWNINRSIATSAQVRRINNDLFTPKFANRNYQVQQWIAEPAISYIRGTKFRATISYSFSDKQNQTGFFEKSSSHVISGETRYNVLSTTSINLKFSYNNLSFKSEPGGNTNSTVGYLLLDGLLPGKNYLWNVELTKRLSGNIEMVVQYDGRQPAASRIVHIGRATVRAIF